MEPLTAIAAIATKYGIASLIGALTGERMLVDLTAELVGALSASEARLSDQLAGIERRLDEVLEQQYTTAVGTGLRTLLDAGTTTDPTVRTDELVRARDLFREAAASARSTLQVAVAERYLALCAIALGRPDAARTALQRLNTAAFETLLDAVGAAGTRAREQAMSQLEQSGWRGNQRRREAQLAELTASIKNAAAEAGGLAGHLLREAGVLAEGLGYGQLPDLRMLPGWRPSGAAGPSLDRWEIRPREPEPARLGPVSVTWHELRFERDPAATGKLGARRSAGSAGAQPSGDPAAAPTTPDTLHVAATVRVNPALSRPIDLTLVLPAAANQRVRWSRPPSWTLPAGDREIRLQHTFSASQSRECVVNVAGVLLFHSALCGDRGPEASNVRRERP